MGNLLKRLLSKLQAQINTTSSSWVKTRNQLYIDLLNIASESMVNRIEKEILK